MKHALTCPVCSNVLSMDMTSLAKHKSLSCIQGHLFDYAKQGYLNLLLSQHKKSKQPGDTLDMVQARTHFLDSGFYDDISHFLINECIQNNLPFASKNTDTEDSTETFNYTDLACGEGFYTHNVHRYLQSKVTNMHESCHLASTGLDISTPAIKAACQRTKDIQWLIASLARTPIANDSQDLVTGLFFHFDLEEVKRILKREGYFIMVTTGPSHLIELRERIYDKVKEEKLKNFTGDHNGLSHINTLKLITSQRLNSSENILSLLAMTPHYWRCTQDKKRALERLSMLDVTLDIQFDIFTKKRSL